MSNFAVVTAHPDTQETVTQSPSNPDFGYVRVESEQIVFNNGFRTKQVRSALIGGPYEELKEWNPTAGTKLPGKIIRLTSLEPFWDNQDPVINPSTGEAVLRDNKLMYQNYIFTEEVNASDRFVDSQVIEETPESTPETKEMKNPPIEEPVTQS